MGVPSCGLCSSHNSGGSTPSVFSQSKNDLGLTLNQLPIVVSRPNVKAIFSPFPLSPPKFTHRVIHQLAVLNSLPACWEHARFRAHIARRTKGYSYENHRAVI